MDKNFQDLFNIEHDRREPKAGSILIAEPFMKNDVFSRSVIYLTEHDNTGSVGFILNLPVFRTLSDLFNDLPDTNTPVTIGGPVETERLYYIHTCKHLKDSLEIADGIYWGGDFLQVKEWLNDGLLTNENIRFFAGYSGWGGGQLKYEIEKDKSWIVSEIDRENLFASSPEKLWETSMERLGGHPKMWANMPTTPELN